MTLGFRLPRRPGGSGPTSALPPGDRSTAGRHLAEKDSDTVRRPPLQSMVPAQSLPALVAVVLTTLTAGACVRNEYDGRRVLRLGHFPNVTHVHGLVAHWTSREGRGWFEERLGASVRVEWTTFHAGPSAMEALLTGAIDATYVGPSPALNAFVKTNGAGVRILAGATRGGAALVVARDSGIESPAGFAGKRIATPQLGNTQDVACRDWLARQGLHVTQRGGDATVLPIHNPDQLTLFRRRELDAAWTVEPWVSRLEIDVGARVFFEDRDASTTVLAASPRFLEREPDLARSLVQAHDQLTDWIRAHPDDARARVANELRAETSRAIAPEVLERAWSRIRVDGAIARDELDAHMRAAHAAGFLRDAVDLSGLLGGPQ